LNTTIEPAVRCVGLGKRFGATVALSNVDLDIAPGTIHALVGENGAGKSTCLGIIGGRTSPSHGEVLIFGTKLHHGDPRASRRAGIAVIYQELSISPHLSTQANVFLGRERQSHGLRQDRAMRSAFVQLCRKMDVHLPADTPAGMLSVADQQLLEIQRALIGDPRIILFDEPTASLAQHERDVLFRVMRDLRASGATLILVSHNLDEVLAISDNVTVFAGGRKIASKPTRAWTKSTLVEAMIGRALPGQQSRPTTQPVEATATPILQIQDLIVPRVLGPIAFELRPGETIGIAGVVGSGRSTLLNALAGLIPNASGRLWIDGRERRWPTTVRQARALGIALVPEDRQAAGLFTSLTGAENIAISDYRPVTRAGLLSRPRMHRAARAVASSVALAERALPVAAANLSGGNQQKLILARWQHSPPRILLCDEPTRGIDIGAKADVMASVKRLVEGGMGVVLVSSELEEIEAAADRAIVIAEGHQVGEVSRHDNNLTVKDILTLAFRAKDTL
jgi:ABC-type sugar transport system ATPase subunit